MAYKVGEAVQVRNPGGEWLDAAVLGVYPQHCDVQFNLGGPRCVVLEDVRPYQMPAWERELLDRADEHEETLVAPKATSFTVTREWLNKVREHIRMGETTAGVEAVDAILPKPERVSATETVERLLIPSLGTVDAHRKAIDIGNGLWDAGYEIKERTDAD